MIPGTPHVSETLAAAELLPGLSLAFACDGKVAVFSIDGELPRDRHGDAEELLLRLLRRGCKHIVGDLSGADRTVVADQGGRIVLVKPRPSLLKRLGRMKLPEWIEFYDTRDEALAALAGQIG